MRYCLMCRLDVSMVFPPEWFTLLNRKIKQYVKLIYFDEAIVLADVGSILNTDHPIPVRSAVRASTANGHRGRSQSTEWNYFCFGKRANQTEDEDF